MALDINITDPTNKLQNSVVQQEGQNCLSVVTQEYKQYLNKSVYFSNFTYGINMNRDFSQIEATVNVHNGNDNAYWTGSIISGQPSDFDFSSTDYAHTGTQSIDCAAAESGDEFQLTNDTFVTCECDRFSGWIYIIGGWEETDGMEIYLYNTTTGEQSSENIVNLANYISTGGDEEWQKFNIPFNDFGTIGDFDAIRFRMVGAPDFYLDDLVLQELTGEPAVFDVRPTKGRWWHIKGMGIVIASSYNSTMTDSSMPNIPYNGLLGTSLTNGINYQRQEEGEIVFSIVIHDMIEIINQYNSQITNYGYDGNYTWVKIDTTFSTPFILKPEFDDFISFNISDDTSGLQMMRVVAAVAEEKRTVGGIYDRNGLLRVREY